MKRLSIEPTLSSPEVILDPDNGVLEISGESRPEDGSKTFEPIIKWFDEFNKELIEIHSPDDKKSFSLKFDLEYFNTVSAKFILDICKKIGRIRSDGFNFSINWYYQDGDEDMLATGEELSKIAKFPFEFTIH